MDDLEFVIRCLSYFQAYAGSVKICYIPAFLSLTHGKWVEQVEAASKTDMPLAEFRRAAKYFRSRGLLQQVTEPADRRRRLVSITPRGEELAKKLDALMTAWEEYQNSELVQTEPTESIVLL